MALTREMNKCHIDGFSVCFSPATFVQRRGVGGGPGGVLGGGGGCEDLTFIIIHKAVA